MTAERKIEIPDEKVYEIIDIINGSTGGGVINNPILEIMELWDHRSCDKAGGNISPRSMFVQDKDRLIRDGL